ncbi:MAG: LegC family aminotransferase [Candidatus Brocadia sp.]|nr:LegC family aminotransferase [Candidatus Brocadia sp.]
MYKKIYLDAPNIGELEKQYLCKAIDSGYISTIGPFVPEFDKCFASYLGVKKAVSVQSGTAALHITLHELAVEKGDEVIVPALTFIATVNPIIYVGATPVFVDVDIETWNIDPKEIEKSITEKTRAIIPVHLYGNPCNMDEILDVAKRYNLSVIEDATESLGATYKGKFTGTFGDMGCFSFNGNKTITTGGGGMVVGNDGQHMDHIQYLINQARDKSDETYHSEIGFNYRMTNIEASLGLAQMQRLEEFLAKKRLIYNTYKEELKGLNNVCFQKEYEGASSSCWLTCITIEDCIPIREVQKKLHERGIPTRRVFTPIHELPPYKEYNSLNCNNSHLIYEKGICLPSSTLNTKDDIQYVCEVLKELIS